MAVPVSLLKLLEQYHNKRPLIFKEEPDKVITQDWEKDIRRLTKALGTYEMQIQRLASFSLQGYTRKWYNTIWILE